MAAGADSPPRKHFRLPDAMDSHVSASYGGHSGMATPPDRQLSQPPQPQLTLKCRGLHGSAVAECLRLGQAEVTTVSQCGSREARGKNVSEDTSLNVDCWMLCEPECALTA